MQVGSGERQLAGLFRPALFYRYDLSRLRGWVFLAVSVFDVLLYAAAISLVMGSVFGLTGSHRFVQMLLGLIAFRWTMSCAIHASRLAFFIRIAEPFHRRPIVATVILAMASPTLVFAITTIGLSAILFVLTARTPADAAHMLAWGGLVILVHLSWNVALVLAVILGRLRGWVQSEVPLIVVLVLVLVLSPVAYLFSDIPAAASQVLTRFNPASHLIAAYQNAFWYLQPVSLETLPASLLVASVAAGLLAYSIRRLHAEEKSVPGRDVLVTWRAGGWLPAHGTRFDDAAIVSPWRGELPWLTGRTLLRLLCPGHGGGGQDHRSFEQISGSGESQQLLDSAVPVYSERARDRFACIAALSLTDRPVVLDRLLDSQTSEEIGEFSEIVAGRPERPDPLTVCCAREDTVRALLAWRSRRVGFSDATHSESA